MILSRQKQLSASFLKSFLVSLMTILVISGCGGKDQIHGMYELQFDRSAICASQEKFAGFQNTSGSELVISGVAKTPGTDVLGVYKLKSIIINGVESLASQGELGEVRIPAAASYTFRFEYKPRTVTADNEGLYDIIYASPRPGVIQLALSGESFQQAGEPTSCSGGISAGGAVAIDGLAYIRVKKLSAATSLIEDILSSDQGSVPFTEVNISLRLSAAQRTATLLAIPQSLGFALPTPGTNAPRRIQEVDIQVPTEITASGEATGTFDPDTGAISIQNARVTMNGDFHADLTITLTTESVDNNLSPSVNASALNRLEELWDPVTRKITGKRIDMSQNGAVVLVGLTRIENFSTENTSLAPMNNGTMAVIIEGNIQQNP